MTVGRGRLLEQIVHFVGGVLLHTWYYMGNFGSCFLTMARRKNRINSWARPKAKVGKSTFPPWLYTWFTASTKRLSSISRLE